jgi:hypothetical protein
MPPIRGCLLLNACFLLFLLFNTNDVPQKCQLTFTRIHTITSQKMELFTCHLFHALKFNTLQMINTSHSSTATAGVLSIIKQDMKSPSNHIQHNLTLCCPPQLKINPYKSDFQHIPVGYIILHVQQPLSNFLYLSYLIAFHVSFPFFPKMSSARSANTSICGTWGFMVVKIKAEVFWFWHHVIL